MTPVRKCLCCGKPESKWIQNEDTAHSYPECDVCQACFAITSWAEYSMQRLEVVIAYLRLCKQQDITDGYSNGNI